ncbi:MAG: ABC transporter permease [Alcaligenaceae bacterium]|nr:ABC transporter permease [Alcaligenaceae bacterium]
MLSRIAYKELLFKPFQNLMLIALIALAIAASVFVVSLNQGLQKGLTIATEPFPQLIAAKGGSNQVVVNTVFLQDNPVGNVSAEVFQAVKNSPLVQQAVPLAFGDNYRGFKVVGASEEIFSFIHQRTNKPWLSIDKGRVFEKPFEVVVGHKAAKMAELNIGDTFRSVHGASEHGMAHEELFTVVGIMKHIGGPYDQVIFSSIETVWMAHDHDAHDHEAEEERASQAEDHEHHDHDEDEDHAHDHEGESEVTAIIVRPAGYGEAMRLAQEYQGSHDAQLIFPAQAVVKLFSMMGQGQQLWTYLGGFLIAVALLLVMVTLYLSGLNSLRERAILLSMGASPRQLLKLSLQQNAMIIATGGLIGYLLGYIVYALLAGLINQRTAIELPISFMSTPFLVALFTVVAGLLVSLIPALLLRRKDVLRFL